MGSSNGGGPVPDEATPQMTGVSAESSRDELAILFDGLDSGVYRYAGRVGNGALQRWAHARGWRAWLLRGDDITDKRTFLDASARALCFPAYFGHNWDAFDECIRDLAGQRAAGYLLVIDAPRAFAVGAPADWQTALQILAEAAAFWQAQGSPFYVLLRRTAGSVSSVPLLR